ncbi:TetR/AcrR family transcriptional regulator [Microbacterium sp. ASV49]|uniref:TetR/AcrR family transcriptional regulator n=1 Tax=Microbacterium candidum TaxID=3041922 RepID=A0ABT7N155_9MICO|nr:TetR/AcrR family transcriptional regulator [Microbacterium sp. ASV49]MDL9980438.1 TetR/AcrR family transcriptional regulator [Microbacterium sp. ASV49]
MSTIETDGRRARGAASRERILAESTDLATTVGLDGVTIGLLAESTGRSKSSIATLFGTKEALQLATVDAAADIFRRQVVDPARALPRGLDRVVALLTALLAYSRTRVFSGGCFFQACAADMGSKPGPVRDAIRDHIASWEGYLEAQVAYAVDSGELTGDAHTLTFTLLALYELSNARSVLTGSEEPYLAAVAGMTAVLEAAGAEPTAALGSYA